MKDHIANPDVLPKNYWANTSSNEIIQRIIEITNASISSEYADLINGKVIQKKINENLTYSELYNSEENFWSLLFETGYVTLAGPYNENGYTLLRLPNEEVKRLFISSSENWFRSSIRKENLTELFNAIWTDNSGKLAELLSDYLFRTISYHDYSEEYYHTFLAGLFSASEYTIKSNMETGEGRSDILIMDTDNKRMAIFEFKIIHDLKELDSAMQKAVGQISSRRYGEEFSSYFQEIHKTAIVFFKKRAYCKKLFIKGMDFY